MTAVREIAVLDPDVAVIGALWGFYLGFACIVVAIGLLMWRVGKLEKQMRRFIDALIEGPTDAAK